jgi:hypothetical protein
VRGSTNGKDGVAAGSARAVAIVASLGADGRERRSWRLGATALLDGQEQQPVPKVVNGVRRQLGEGDEFLRAGEPAA